MRSKNLNKESGSQILAKGDQELPWKMLIMPFLEEWSDCHIVSVTRFVHLYKELPERLWCKCQKYKPASSVLWYSEAPYSGGSTLAVSQASSLGPGSIHLGNACKMPCTCSCSYSNINTEVDQKPELQSQGKFQSWKGIGKIPAESNKNY